MAQTVLAAAASSWAVLMGLAPLLQIRRIHFDEQHRAFEYMDMLASPSRFELHLKLGESDNPAV